MGHNAKMKHLMTNAYKDYFVMFTTKVVKCIFSGTSCIRNKLVYKGVG